MKTIGMLGGMSWESTLNYYKALNEGVKNRMGGLHSAKIHLCSVDFAEIEKLQQEGDWPAMADILSDAARSIEQAGAEMLLICTNTMHKVAPEIERSIAIPLVHIADATAESLLNEGIHRVGLLGTRFTMAESFYKGRLTEKYGIEVLVPPAAEQERVHQVIYHELCCGRIEESSRADFLEIIDGLSRQGAEGVILGCTEIALLVQPRHTSVPLFDTTAIHASKAVELALEE